MNTIDHNIFFIKNKIEHLKYKQSHLSFLFSQIIILIKRTQTKNIKSKISSSL